MLEGTERKERDETKKVVKEMKWGENMENWETTRLNAEYLEFERNMIWFSVEISLLPLEPLTVLHTERVHM